MNPTFVQEWLTEPGGLAERLRAMRKAAGLTGKELTQQTGFGQSKISKLETGRQTPTDDDLRRWADACGASSETTSALLEQRAALVERQRTWHRRLAGNGQTGVQRTFVELSHACRTFRNLELVTVPGLAQTPAYAAGVFAEMADLHGLGEDPAAAVAHRMERQQVLYVPGKSFELLMSEGALRRVVGDLNVMRGQFDRLRVLSGLENVRVGVLPLNCVLATTPQNAFALFDDEAYVETFTGETVHRGEEAAMYDRVMDRMWADAVEGPALSMLLDQVMKDLERRAGTRSA